MANTWNIVVRTCYQTTCWHIDNKYLMPSLGARLTSVVDRVVRHVNILLKPSQKFADICLMPTLPSAPFLEPNPNETWMNTYSFTFFLFLLAHLSSSIFTSAQDIPTYTARHMRSRSLQYHAPMHLRVNDCKNDRSGRWPKPNFSSSRGQS